MSGVKASARQQWLEQALFRGAALSLQNQAYLAQSRTILGALYASDCLPAGAYRRAEGRALEAGSQASTVEGVPPHDLTAAALELGATAAQAVIVSRDSGVAAGLEEAADFLQTHGIRVAREARDSQPIESGTPLMRLEGDRRSLLALERTALNLLQRMSGIATATERLQRLAWAAAPSVRVVATRKTPWGLLDKRAVHWGGGGTHRLGLGDAILIKNNHLALLGGKEEDACPIAVRRAWERRGEAAFIEVEVRSEPASLAAARAFRDLQDRRPAVYPYPSLILLDNMRPENIAAALEHLKQERLWEHVLLEASGAIGEENIAQYAASGVDAISVGALTHSVQALDISMRMI
jgi:nicotinate-nucleotide pyrophosphorylase (carboxylating)